MESKVCAKCKVSETESTKIFNNLKNLQPLLAYENLKKGSRYE